MEQVDTELVPHLNTLVKLKCSSCSAVRIHADQLSHRDKRKC